jgi:hypothetical protein
LDDTIKGGPGSGYDDPHYGRPGEVGGSSPRESSRTANDDKSKGKIANNTLRWKSEDTIIGEIVIEYDDKLDLSKITTEDLKDYIKKHYKDMVSHLRSANDIEDITISDIKKGKGWISFKLDITPSTSAGDRWLDETGGGEEWSTYHE